jgi:hypothetical protein
MSGVSFVRASADLSSPLGECLPDALATADGSRDVGRVSVDSARLIGEATSLRSNAVQRFKVRLFQSQAEPGPRFFDALITEYSCGTDRLQLEIDVPLFTVENDPRAEALARRVDSLMNHVLSDCKTKPLSVVAAGRTAGVAPPC